MNTLRLLVVVIIITCVLVGALYVTGGSRSSGDLYVAQTGGGDPKPPLGPARWDGYEMTRVQEVADHHVVMSLHTNLYGNVAYICGASVTSQTFFQTWSRSSNAWSMESNVILYDTGTAGSHLVCSDMRYPVSPDGRFVMVHGTNSVARIASTAATAEDGNTIIYGSVGGSTTRSNIQCWAENNHVWYSNYDNNTIALKSWTEASNTWSDVYSTSPNAMGAVSAYQAGHLCVIRDADGGIDTYTADAATPSLILSSSILIDGGVSRVALSSNGANLLATGPGRTCDVMSVSESKPYSTIDVSGLSVSGESARFMSSDLIVCTVKDLSKVTTYTHDRNGNIMLHQQRGFNTAPVSYPASAVGELSDDGVYTMLAVNLAWAIDEFRWTNTGQ